MYNWRAWRHPFFSRRFNPSSIRPSARLSQSTFSPSRRLLFFSTPSHSQPPSFFSFCSSILYFLIPSTQNHVSSRRCDIVSPPLLPPQKRQKPESAAKRKREVGRYVLRASFLQYPFLKVFMRECFYSLAKKKIFFCYLFLITEKYSLCWWCSDTSRILKVILVELFVGCFFRQVCILLIYSLETLIHVFFYSDYVVQFTPQCNFINVLECWLKKLTTFNLP